MCPDHCVGQCFLHRFVFRWEVSSSSLRRLPSWMWTWWVSCASFAFTAHCLKVMFRIKCVCVCVCSLFVHSDVKADRDFAFDKGKFFFEQLWVNNLPGASIAVGNSGCYRISKCFKHKLPAVFQHMFALFKLFFLFDVIYCSLRVKTSTVLGGMLGSRDKSIR